MWNNFRLASLFRETWNAGSLSRGLVERKYSPISPRIFVLASIAQYLWKYLLLLDKRPTLDKQNRVEYRRRLFLYVALKVLCLFHIWIDERIFFQENLRKKSIRILEKQC